MAMVSPGPIAIQIRTRTSWNTSSTSEGSSRWLRLTMRTFSAQRAMRASKAAEAASIWDMGKV